MSSGSGGASSRGSQEERSGGLEPLGAGPPPANSPGDPAVPGFTCSPGQPHGGARGRGTWGGRQWRAALSGPPLPSSSPVHSLRGSAAQGSSPVRPCPARRTPAGLYPAAPAPTPPRRGPAVGTPQLDAIGPVPPRHPARRSCPQVLPSFLRFHPARPPHSHLPPSEANPATWPGRRSGTFPTSPRFTPEPRPPVTTPHENPALLTEHAEATGGRRAGRGHQGPVG